MVECIRCDWFGYWNECRVSKSAKTDPGSICPKCKSLDSMVEKEDDGVSEQDYIDQNPLYVPKE